MQERDIFENIAYYILLITTFLLPLFFIPSTLVTLPFAKSMLLVLAICVAFALHLFSVLKKGSVTAPFDWIFVAVLSIPIVFLISSLASPTVSFSLVGYGFEAGTFSYILALVMYLYLVAILFRTKESVFYSYLVFFVSLFLIALFHISRLVFGASFLSFGFFPEIVSNTLGHWGSLAGFFGLGTILSLITFEMLSLNRLFKTLLYTAFVVSLAFLMLVNVPAVWSVLAIFSLIFFVYIFSFSVIPAKKKGVSSDSSEGTEIKISTRKFSVQSLVVLLISIAFLFAGNWFGGVVNGVFGIQNVDVWPSWRSTVQIASDTYKEGVSSLLLGSGPNNFTLKWLAYKPIGANNGVFWNTDFGSAVGNIPTFAITTGVLGLLSWIAFLSLFVYIGFYSIFSKTSDTFSRYLMVSSFSAASFLWAVNIFYIPSLTIFVLAFFFSGLFFASAMREGVVKSRNFVFSNSPRISFAITIVLILILIANIGFGYLLFQKSISSVFYQKSLISLYSSNDIDSAERQMIMAIDLSQNDVYLRSLSEINLVQLNWLLNNTEMSQEVLARNFQLVLGAAVANAQTAIRVNATNYQNWLALANVYASVAPLGVPETYESAISSFEEAIKRNPKNPSIDLSLARLEAGRGDFVKAREHINNALQKKGNYTEAMFTLSQIEVSDGKIEQAIQAASSALLVEPSNPVVYFRLGMLHYNNSDFPKAISAFDRAISIVPDYSNARYFLGLSYDKTNKSAEAIAQFERIAELNPDNEEIKFILNNLKEGKDPFADAVLPIDDSPEKRSSLPVEEDIDGNDAEL